MPYYIRDPQLNVQNVGVVDTTAQHPIGTIARAYDPTVGTLGNHGEFIYLRGAASLVAGDLVTYDTSGAGVTTRWAGTANSGDLLAVAVGPAVPTATQFGWFQIQGLAAVNVQGTVAAGDRAFYGAVTATVKTAATAGAQVIGMKAVSASASGQATYQFNRPAVQTQIT